MSGIDIRAAIATDEKSPFAIENVTLCEPTDDELRIKIVATSVCHTDLMTKNKGLCQFPIVLGHEGAGVVDAIGANVVGYEIGDHVILSYDYCAVCPQCKDDKPSYCDQHGVLNFAGTRPDGRTTHQHSDDDVYGSFFQQSSFATFALTHPTNTIKVDKSLPLATLAPLGCGVQTGAGTVLNTLKVKADTTIAIFGCGCVGLAAVMAAKIAGARNIIAIDINSDRLAIAGELGATHTLQPTDYENGAALIEGIRTISKSGGSHYAIDTTGIPDVLRQAFDCCRPMGVTAMIAPGVPGTEVTVEMLGLLPGKSLRGVVQGDSVSRTFIPRLIEYWQQGSFPFDRLITSFVGLDSLNEAATAMAHGNIIKPVILIDETYAP